MDARLCDDDGVVSDEHVTPSNALNPTLTYRGLLNNLRRVSGHEPYQGKPFTCTGSAHLAGEHIRCTSPAHARPADPPTTAMWGTNGAGPGVPAPVYEAAIWKQDVKRAVMALAVVPPSFFADAAAGHTPALQEIAEAVVRAVRP